MKNLLGITLLFMCFAFRGIAQNSNISLKDNITGVWNLNYERSILEMDSIAHIRYNNDFKLRIRIERSYKGRVLHFNLNGDFLQYQSDGSVKLGRWQIEESDNKRILYIVSPESQQFAFDVLELNDSHLVLKPFDKTKTDTYYFKGVHYDKK